MSSKKRSLNFWCHYISQELRWQELLMGQLEEHSIKKKKKGKRIKGNNLNCIQANWKNGTKI